MGVQRLLCRRERSTNRVSGRERQPRRRISSTCRRFSSSPEAGSSLGLRMRACCSPRGCSGCKTSSVCLCHLLTLLSISSRRVCPLHMGGDCRERNDPHRGCAGRLDRGPVGGPHHLPQGSSSQPTSPNSHFLFQLMAGISWLLAEASKCPGVDYMYDGELVKSEEGNDTLEVMEYEYDYDVESPR